MRKNRMFQAPSVRAHTANLLIVAAITSLCIVPLFNPTSAFAEKILQKMPTENTYTNSIGMKFVRIRPCTFAMGRSSASFSVFDRRQEGPDKQLEPLCF